VSQPNVEHQARGSSAAPAYLDYAMTLNKADALSSLQFNGTTTVVDSCLPSSKIDDQELRYCNMISQPKGWHLG
jgi:hypothetical protein